jgi:hypothetical protein
LSSPRLESPAHDRAGDFASCTHPPPKQRSSNRQHCPIFGTQMPAHVFTNGIQAPTQHLPSPQHLSDCVSPRSSLRLANLACRSTGLAWTGILIAVTSFSSALPGREARIIVPHGPTLRPHSRGTVIQPLNNAHVAQRVHWHASANYRGHCAPSLTAQFRTGPTVTGSDSLTSTV